MTARLVDSAREGLSEYASSSERSGIAKKGEERVMLGPKGRDYRNVRE